MTVENIAAGVTPRNRLPGDDELDAALDDLTPEQVTALLDKARPERVAKRKAQERLDRAQGRAAQRRSRPEWIASLARLKNLTPAGRQFVRLELRAQNRPGRAQRSARPRRTHRARRTRLTRAGTGDAPPDPHRPADVGGAS